MTLLGISVFKTISCSEVSPDPASTVSEPCSPALSLVFPVPCVLEPLAAFVFPELLACENILMSLISKASADCEPITADFELNVRAQVAVAVYKVLLKVDIIVASCGGFLFPSYDSKQTPPKLTS